VSEDETSLAFVDTEPAGTYAAASPTDKQLQAIAAKLDAWWFRFGAAISDEEWQELIKEYVAAPRSAVMIRLARGSVLGKPLGELEEQLRLDLAAAAERDDVQARSILVRLRRDRLKIDRAGLIDVLKGGAEAGDPDAAHWLGTLLVSSKEAPADPDKLELAEQYLRQAVEGGQMRALYNLARVEYWRGDTVSASKTLLDAAEQGDRRARREYIAWLRSDTDLRSEPARMIELAEQWLDEAQGPSPHLAYHLAQLYELHTEIDGGTIKRLYHQAAVNGHRSAARHLIAIGFEGLREVPPDPEMAIENLELLAHFSAPEDLFLLARLHLEGVYIDRDVDRAVELLEQAAVADHAQAKEYLARIKRKKNK
jgi:TPR repeat protein